VKSIDFASILRAPEYLGFRMAMVGVGIGFIAFIIAICGFMFLGVSVFAVGISTTLTGIVAGFSHVNRRK
jgi:protein-S-isoprenylcysteine O-methyltransferase Ste14